MMIVGSLSVGAQNELLCLTRVRTRWCPDGLAGGDVVDGLKRENGGVGDDGLSTCTWERQHGEQEVTTGVVDDRGSSGQPSRKTWSTLVRRATARRHGEGSHNDTDSTTTTTD